MKLVSILLTMVMLSVPQEKMVKTKVTDGITVKLPESFYAMGATELAQRFPSVRRPLGAYTNEDRLVDFSVKISATQWRESDIEMAQQFFKASIYNLYDRVDPIQEGLREINKKNYIVFEFDSRINGDEDNRQSVRAYSYAQYLLINGKTLVFTFTCPIKLKEKWQPMAREIMNSIKVKNSI